MLVDKLIIVAARETDARYIGENLREEDLVELRMAHGQDSDPAKIVAEAYGKSTMCWVGIDKSAVPVVIFGAGEVDPDIGAPWLLATDEVLKYKALLVSQVKEYVLEMKDYYPRLVNMVYARNKTAIRWLEKLGFEVGEEVPAGPYREPFRPFKMEARNVQH